MSREPDNQPFIPHVSNSGYGVTENQYYHTWNVATTAMKSEIQTFQQNFSDLWIQHQRHKKKSMTVRTYCILDLDDLNTENCFWIPTNRYSDHDFRKLDYYFLVSLLESMCGFDIRLISSIEQQKPTRLL